MNSSMNVDTLFASMAQSLFGEQKKPFNLTVGGSDLEYIYTLTNTNTNSVAQGVSYWTAQIDVTRFESQKPRTQLRKLVSLALG